MIRTRQFFAVFVALACTTLSSLRAEDKGQVWPLPAWDDAAAWTSKSAGEKPFSVFSSEKSLFVRFDCAKENVAELRLKEPIPMPADATGFTFLCGNNGAVSGLWIKVLAQDSKGKEFAFHTTSWFSFQKGVFFPEHIQRRVCVERFVTPGFDRVEMEPSSNATIEGPAPHVKPVPPYTLVGLRFVGEHQRKEEAFTELFFKDFAITKLDPRNSPLYYQFRDHEGFGELDPLPYLTPAHMGKHYGKRFDMSWELRDSYDGNPFLVDGKTFEFTQVGWQEKGDGVPYPLQIAQKIEFPVKEKGTYWARVRMRWSHDGKSPIPQQVEEREFRLDVVNGAEKIERQPVTADVMAPNCFIRVAPERKTLIFNNDEKFTLKVAFRNPGEAVKDASYRAVIKLASGEEEVKALDIAPVWEGDKPFIAEVDLSDLKPATYKVLAEIRAGKQLFDQVERLIARTGTAAAAADAPIPASVPSWKEMLASPKPMFHLTPILPDNLPQSGAKAWDEYYRPFLDKAGELSTQIEFAFDWNTVEPLPGVFDWGIVDRFVEYAQSKGLTVQLWPSFRDLPEWVPAKYEMSVDGKVFGSKQAYLFHGGRPNYVHAPEIRNRIVEFIKNVAQRYRGHPAVHSYFFCFEHPGDAPYAGWFEGYAAESVQAFRREVLKTLKTIAAANTRWGTTYASWDEVVPPPKSASSQYRLDWLRFKTNGIEGLLKDCVTAIRSADPKRLIDMYADGAADLRWFSEQGCMSANGGSHDTMAMPDYAAFPLAGLPQRTEDHSPGNWTAYFPTQLDASVFAMMAGGGANAHCKAYVFSKNRFSDMADPNVSLGRYKRFMPIWTELRAADLAQPIEAFLLKDHASYLVAANTTYGGWWGDPWGVVSLSQAHVPAAAGYGDLWKNGKLLIAISSQHLREMEAGLLDRVAAFVENGGTLLMSADAGRKSLDAPGEDWVLLHRFGVAPPEGDVIPSRNTLAVPAPGAIFKDDAKAFTLREIWKVKPPEGMETAAFFDGDQQRAALSWKSVGKGKVAVLWAQTVVPPLFSQPNGSYPFLRDIARWAGIQPMADSTDSRLWTNLLKTKDGSTFYGLAHVGSWQHNPATGVDCAARWLVLPEGNYHVTELISGKEIGDFTAAQLKSDGLPVKLGPREVAIFRMTKK